MHPMDHQTWAKEFALRKNSVAKLRAFHSQVKKIAGTSVGRWHVEQVAGYLAMVLADNGEKKGAARSFQRLVRESHGEMMYHARNTRDKAEIAAELYESLGNKCKAKRLREDIAALDTFIASRLQRRKRGE
jgi:hypothetical protein